MVKWAGLELDHVFLSLSLGGWSLVRGVALYKGGFRILSSGRSMVKKGRASDAAGPRMPRGLGCCGDSGAMGLRCCRALGCCGALDAAGTLMLQARAL